MSIPFIQLGISPVTQEKLAVLRCDQQNAGWHRVKDVSSDEEALSVLMILSQDTDPSVSAVARALLRRGTNAAWVWLSHDKRTASGIGVCGPISTSVRSCGRVHFSIGKSQ